LEGKKSRVSAPRHAECNIHSYSSGNCSTGEPDVERTGRARIGRDPARGGQARRALAGPSLLGHYPALS
jgi:hypothetical protein